MHKKSILFITGNYFPELTGIGRYNTEMIDWLADNGFECTVVTTYPNYPHWKVQKPYHKKRIFYTSEIKITAKGNKIKIHRCPHYVPAKPTARRRVLSDMTYFSGIFFRLVVLLTGKYDYVMNVTPPLVSGLLAVWFMQLKKAKFIYHIQDLQADAAMELKMIKRKSFLNLILKLETYIIHRAHFVSTISEGMAQKVREKTFRPVFIFPNWTNTRRFFPIDDKEVLKEDFGFDAAQKIILYSGAIGAKQGLESIVDAAIHFQNKEDYLFVICGSGPYKAKLESISKIRSLFNMRFIPLQKEQNMNNFLNMADLHLVMQKAASDLFMPSKLTNILATGSLALVTANPGSGLHQLIEKYKMAILAPAENNELLCTNISYALSQPHNRIKANARCYAEKYLSMSTVLKNYTDTVFAQ